ncbi:uncharacterized protein ACIBXB_004070 [Morphnus guianensis]
MAEPVEPVFGGGRRGGGESPGPGNRPARLSSEAAGSCGLGGPGACGGALARSLQALGAEVITYRQPCVSEQSCSLQQAWLPQPQPSGRSGQRRPFQNGDRDFKTPKLVVCRSGWL